MSTPFPPNSKLKGLSAYAPPRVRDRALSQDPAEITDPSAQADAAESKSDRLDYPQAEHEQTATAQDAGSPSEGDAIKDPLDWLDDAIRAVVELKHASDSDGETDPSLTAPNSPSITPMHESDHWPPSDARRHDRTEFRTSRPQPPGLETHIVPPPPPVMRQGGRFGPIVRTSLMIVFAAIVAYAVTLFYPSRQSAPQPNGSGDRIAEATPQQPQQAETQAASLTPPDLIVENQQVFANEPVPLAVNVEHATGNESLLLDGLVRGTTLSAGTAASPSSWQISPDKLRGLYLYAPKDFVGVMKTTVNLLGPDKRLLDSRAMKLKWVSKPPPQPPQPQQPVLASAGNEAPASVRSTAVVPPVVPVAPAVKPIDPGEAALLMQQGRQFLSAGDISAARVAFRRLADAGMPDAALALANTYDPAYLTAHDVVGVIGDRAMARTLYQRAKDLGSAEASRILADMGFQ